MSIWGFDSLKNLFSFSILGKYETLPVRSGFGNNMVIELNPAEEQNWITQIENVLPRGLSGPVLQSPWFLMHSFRQVKFFIATWIVYSLVSTSLWWSDTIALLLWFSTFLMAWPYDIVPHIIEMPICEIIWLLLHNCIFCCDYEPYCNYLICYPQRGWHLQVENCCSTVPTFFLSDWTLSPVYNLE